VFANLPVLHVHLRRGGGGPDFAKVDDVDLPLTRDVHQRESAAAEAARLRLDDGEREGRRDRRVHGVPAVPEDRRTGFARQGMSTSDRALRRYGGRGEEDREQRIHMEDSGTPYLSPNYVWCPRNSGRLPRRRGFVMAAAPCR